MYRDSLSKKVTVSEEPALRPLILSCHCKHEYQDKLYGKGKRVMNPTEKSIYGTALTNTGRLYRCTVCKRERTK